MTIVTDDSPRRSSLSFSLRGLLLAAFAIAATSIAAGPFVRSLEAEQRVGLAWIIAAAAFGAILPAVVFCWLRYRVEKRGGALIISLENRYRFLWRILVTLSVLLPIYSSVYITGKYLRAAFIL